MKLKLSNDINFRDSRIEVLKIAACLFIIIGHTVRAITSPGVNMESADYILDISHSTDCFQLFFLAVLRTLGPMGNLIFFICSSYFLMENDYVSKKKIVKMSITVLFISLIFLVFRRAEIGAKMVVRCLFPTTFSNNWYVTCYFLFYAVHSVINMWINEMSQREHLRVVIVLCTLYVVINYIKGHLFFSNELIIWLTVYMLFIYVKKYMPEFVKNRRKNILLLFMGVIGHVGIMLLSNIIGLRYSLFSKMLLHWSVQYSPFLISIAIALLNLMTFEGEGFSNYIVNSISKCSLLIYLIHDNIIVRNYYMPILLNTVYIKYGYNFVVVWILLISIFIFIISLVMALLFNFFFSHVLEDVSLKVYQVIKNFYMYIENLLLYKK